MSHRIDEEKLTRYFAGVSSSEEEAEVRAWIEAHPSFRQFACVEDAAEQGTVVWDKEGAWDRLSGRISTSSRPWRSATDRSPARVPSRRLHGSRMAPLLRVAAVVALVALSTWAAARFFNSPPTGVASEGSAMRVFSTNAGEQARIRLGDGTRLVLNVASELRVSATFAAGTRDVYLEGEAYFEVAPDAEHPFRVHAGGAVARVLGTAFDVRAYPEEEKVAVVVAEGRVALGRTGEEAVAPADTLTRRQMGRLLRAPSGGLTVVENVNVSRHLGWLEGRLAFKDARVSEVMAQLERWYGLDVQLADSVLATRRLTGSFTEEPVDEVLRIIALSLGARYEKTGRHVVFFPGGEE